MLCPMGLDDGGRAGVSTRCCDQIIPSVGGADESDCRGVERAKVLPRSRFNAALLNTLSSFTVEPMLRRRTGTDSWSGCIGLEIGLTDEAATSGGEALAAVSARKAPQPSTAAARATAATMANAGCRRDQNVPTPRFTVPCTLPAAIHRQPTRHVQQTGIEKRLLRERRAPPPKTGGALRPSAARIAEVRWSPEYPAASP